MSNLNTAGHKSDDIEEKNDHENYLEIKTLRD